MTTVTITAGDKPVNVTSQRIVEDGRQRFPNGVDRIEPGASEQFIVSVKQSLMVEEVVEAEAPADEVGADADTPEATPEA